MGKTVVYISGKITGDEHYKEVFDQHKAQLEELGNIVLSPADLPEGMTKEQYMRINFAQIDAAHVVYFIPGWASSPGAALEHAYCKYIGKEVIE